MLYFIISFMSFYRGAIIYNLPNDIIPSAIACLQLGSSAPKKCLFLLGMVTNNTFQFQSCKLSQLEIENFCLPVFIFAAHVLRSQFPDGCPHTLSPALMWIITEPHRCPQSPCQHLLMFPVCTSR